MSVPISPLTEIGDHVAANVPGLILADNLFLAWRPDSPDDLVVLTQYFGNSPEFTQERNLAMIESLQVQVLTRSKDYAKAEAWSYKIWRLFCNVVNRDLGGTRYLSITPNHSPSLMGHDANDRALVFFNATVEKEVPLVV